MNLQKKQKFETTIAVIHAKLGILNANTFFEIFGKFIYSLKYSVMH